MNAWWNPAIMTALSQSMSSTHVQNTVHITSPIQVEDKPHLTLAHRSIQKLEPEDSLVSGCRHNLSRRSKSRDTPSPLSSERHDLKERRSQFRYAGTDPTRLRKQIPGRLGRGCRRDTPGASDLKPPCRSNSSPQKRDRFQNVHQISCRST